MSGFQYKSPPNDMDVVSEFNRWSELCAPYIKNGDWCFDIGANLGLISLVFRSLTGPDGKVICFEPIKGAYHGLVDNINSNHLTNVDSYNLAVDTQDGKKIFAENPFSGYGGWNGGFLTETLPRVSDAIKTQVECVEPIEFLYKKYGQDVIENKLKFVKIDIEGYDYIMLNHMKDFLLKIKPVIVMEWYLDEKHNDNIFNAIENLGFTPLRTDNLLPARRSDYGNKSTDILLLPPQ